MPRKIPPEAPPEPEPTVEPPFYEATEDLYVSHPEAGVMPLVAYRAGDRVVPDVVEPNGWGGKVRVPEVFAGKLSPPAGSVDEPASNPDSSADSFADPAAAQATTQPDFPALEEK